jgi:hypothetical protein
VITATATNSGGNTSEFSPCANVPALAFSVTNTGDNGGVNPAPGAGTGTLRQAIIDANANPGLDMITFNIPGGGVKTIAVLSILPDLTNPVTIDGTTQPGFAGSPLIELDGTGAGGGFTDGLRIATTNTTIKGLVINRFAASGIAILTDENRIEGNYIGTDASGTLDRGNNAGISIVFGANLNTIGGTALGARNVISGNNFSGIAIGGTGTTGNLVQGNFIGTDASGTLNLGNSANGVEIVNFASSNTIGGTAAGAGNLIAFNGFTGVRVDSSSINNPIRGNSIHSNAQRGIDLVAAGDPAGGVTPNDNCDPDSGPNNLQNYPVLTSATSSGANVMVAGSLNSAANTTFRIDIFSNSVCDGSGNGEGQTYLGSTIVATNAGCTANFNINLIANVPVGQHITATATDPANNTSEFSGCVQVACGYAISPTTQFFSTRGGQGSVNILAGGSSCAWSATSKDDWIAITSADSGSGNDIVTFEVRENFTGSARQGSINVSGQTFTVVQDGDLGEECQYSINPKFETISAGGGDGMVNVTTTGQCAWQAVSSANWITITSGGVGIGNGTVTYSVGANAGPSGRSGRITIGGQAFAIKQRGN